MKIEICGPGCPKCRSVNDSVQKAIKKLGLGDKAEVQKITDIKDIISKGIMITPGLLIDDIKVSEGKVPSETEIEKWIQERI